jgi:hypothetical protein
MAENQANLEDEELDMESNFQKAFGWYVVTNRIAQNDFTKHDHIYEKTINEVLNQLSYLISYDNEQIRLQKKAQNK